jgi:hypothetical protein
MKRAEKNIPIALHISNGFRPALSTKFIEIKQNDRSTIDAIIVTRVASDKLKPADKKI